MRQASLFDVGIDGRLEPSALLAAETAPSAFASVLVDIPTRSLSEPFAYAVSAVLSERAQVGCAVLVRFGNRPALGYVIARADSLADLPGADGLDPAKVKPIRDVLTERCSARCLQSSPWMRASTLRLQRSACVVFLPPGKSPSSQASRGWFLRA